MDMAYATFQDMDESTIATEYLKTLLAYAESVIPLIPSHSALIGGTAADESVVPQRRLRDHGSRRQDLGLFR